MHMSRVFKWFGVAVLLVCATGVASAASARFICPGLDAVGAGGYRADRIEVRLRPWAASTARASMEIAGRLQSRAAKPTVPSLGLATLDRVAASMGVLAFEPEFRGESPRAVGDRAIDFTSFYVASLAQGSNVEAALAALRSLPDVESADPIAILPVSLVPNDSLFATSWWFGPPPGISAAAAWDLSSGDSSIAIAILDTGVLPWHPDLGGTTPGSSGVIWTNAAEANGLPGVDDDANGYIDDVHGWDFINLSGSGEATAGEDWRDEDNDPNDFAGHGTEVGGLASALTNNTIGVAGTAYSSRLIPLRVGWSAPGASFGVVDMSYVAQAIRYATRAGARIMNCSFQTVNQGGLFAAVDDAVAAGRLIVVAGGNGDPCPIPASDCHELADREDVLAVGALDETGNISSFSERGEYIDVLAPGSNIKSTFLFRIVFQDSIHSRLPTYAPLGNGTSLSAPIACGVAAMVLARDAELRQRPLRPMELQFRLRENADPLGTTTPVTGVASGGVGQLDAARAVANTNVSFGIHAGARTTGAAVGIVTTGVHRIAVYATTDSALLFLSSNGDTLRRIPLGAGVVGSPAATDMRDGQGIGIFVALDNATVAGFNGYGDALSGWPAALDATDEPPGAGPSLGDVDGDGVCEVVCPSSIGVIFVWHANGQRMAPFPFGGDGAPPSGPITLADLDGAPGLELVLGSQGGRMYAYRASTAIQIWQRTLGAGLRAPLVMRQGATGGVIIVGAYGTSLRAYTPAGGLLFTKPLGGTPAEDPIAADINGDGADEIIVPLVSTDELAAFDSTGNPLVGWPVVLPDLVTGPVLARVTSPFDVALAAVLVPSGRRLLAFDGAGAQRSEFPKPGHAGDASTIFDVGGASHERVLAGSGDDGLIYFYLPTGLAAPVDVAKSWLTFRGNFARTGSRLATPIDGVLNNVPARVTDLVATNVRDSSLTLEWTATGGDSTRGRPSYYEVAASPTPLDYLVRRVVFPTVDAGGRETIVLPALAPATTYHFTVDAHNTQGEGSIASNVVTATTLPTAAGGPLAGVRGPAVISLAQPARLPITVFWKAAQGVARQTLSIYDVGGRLRQRFELGAGPGGSVVWNGADRSGELLESGIYFVRLVSGGAHATARIVLLK